MELELLIWTFIVIICYAYLVDVIRILQRYLSISFYKLFYVIRAAGTCVAYRVIQCSFILQFIGQKSTTKRFLNISFKTLENI